MNPQVLVIDDNPTTRTLACEVLFGDGYRVLSAANAAEALSVLHSSHPNLILLDPCIPGLDALAMIRGLRADANTQDTIIVALTPSAVAKDTAPPMITGCDGYIAKPADPATISKSIAAHLHTRVRSGLTVLVVDDDAAQRDLLRSNLEAEGITIIEAGDGLAALDELGKLAIDIIISDLLMPRMDGYRLCFEVRKNKKLRTIPIIILTGSCTGTGDAKFALAIGADRFLIKPALSAEVLRAVCELGLLPRSTLDLDVGADRELLQSQEYNQRLVDTLAERTTELTQATFDLQVAQEKTRRLLLHSPAVLYALAIDGAHVRPYVISDSITALTGFSVAESLGYDWWVQHLHPDDKAGAIAAMDETLQLGSNRSEYRLLHMDGTYRFVEDSRRVVRDSSNRPKEIVGVLSDVTERKRSDEALRDSESRFRQFADNIREVLWMMTPECSDMLYVSPAYEKIWGRPAAQLYLHPEDRLNAILPDFRQQVVDTFARLGKNEEMVSVEYPIALPDGSTRWILDRGFPIRTDAGQLVRIAGIASDITDRKRQEDSRLRSHKMEAVGQLAGGIAHDFNNILSCILGYAELALMDAPGNERVNASLQQVLGASHRAKELIRQILTFSSQQEEERKPIKLQPLINEALRLHRASLPTTIEVNLDIDSTAPTVLANATQVHQVILNLISNAAHSMNGSGTLSIGLASVQVDSILASTYPDLEAGCYARVSVRDTGHGMNSDILRHLFEPFFTTKPPGEGTGLGLAVVHGIMKSHNGAVTVYSELGRGTLFHVYFPAEAQTPADTDTPTNAIVMGGGQHILVVDDDASVALLNQLVLEHAGYLVTRHTCALDALAAFQMAPYLYDMVLTDLTMPGMNGVELAEEMLKLRPELPIVLTTGFGSPMTVAKAVSLGIREVLLKPSTALSLTECTQRSLAGTVPA